MGRSEPPRYLAASLDPIANFVSYDEASERRVGSFKARRTMCLTRRPVRCPRLRRNAPKSAWHTKPADRCGRLEPRPRTVKIAASPVACRALVSDDASAATIFLDHLAYDSVDCGFVLHAESPLDHPYYGAGPMMRIMTADTTVFMARPVLMKPTKPYPICGVDAAPNHAPGAVPPGFPSSSTACGRSRSRPARVGDGRP